MAINSIYGGRSSAGDLMFHNMTQRAMSSPPRQGRVPRRELVQPGAPAGPARVVQPTQPPMPPPDLPGDLMTKNVGGLMAGPAPAAAPGFAAGGKDQGLAALLQKAPPIGQLANNPMIAALMQKARMAAGSQVDSQPAGNPLLEQISAGGLDSAPPGPELPAEGAFPPLELGREEAMFDKPAPLENVDPLAFRTQRRRRGLFDRFAQMGTRF